MSDPSPESLSASILHAGECPACKEGVRGFRIVADRTVLICPECEAIWSRPDADRLFTRQPDSTLPDSEQSVWAANTHWASRAEIEAAGWGDAIEGTSGGAEPSGHDDARPLVAAVNEPAATGDTNAIPAWNDHPRTRAIRDTLDSLGPLHRITIARSEPDGNERAMLEACLELVLSFCQLPMTGGAVTSPSGRGLVATLELGSHDAVLATIDVSASLPSRQWVELACEQGSVVCDDIFDPPAGATRFWIHGGEHEGGRTFEPIAADQIVTGEPLPTTAAGELAERILSGADRDHTA